ncbi:M48 family metallopeptidase [Ottowia testudinis]|uniref:M48 family metalloprotease n=1 Tax=Ottowia testudinis TaxID=2816950 RepID=A0A975H4L0_9BURK|nr:M48 family metallopeptidase [Ottowia testudinis]QTD46470.1 M48 family metalloprotease [Ottowia testudinis]
MERAEFMHLLRLSEQASEEDSARYRRNVWLFAALGYAWVIGCGLLALLILGGIAYGVTHGGRFRAGYIWAILGAGGLLWVSLKALWLRLEPPQGQQLKRDDAPALFDLLDRIRTKIKGPPIHRVLLDDEYNASIQQHPRFGIFGGAINTLTVGLPLLMALDTRRFAAVLAHEYGHLRGDHGRFAAWIYRSRLSWAQLHEGLSRDSGVASWATNAFLNWYFPRFAAKTFALARQDEYEADRIAGRIAGADVAAAALIEVAVKGAWLNEQFWAAHWRAAGAQPLPVGPFGAMRTLLAQPLDAAFAQDALRAELKALPAVDDTHPGLRDRLEALDAAKKLPDWSAKSAMGLLADRRRWIAQFDSAWCKANATAWKQHHACLGRMRQRLDYLHGRAGSANAAEWTEMGELTHRLDATAPVAALFERALAQTPGYPGALRGLVAALPPGDARRMALIEQLHDASAPHRWWAARQAVATLERAVAEGHGGDADLKRWRERLKQAEDAEQRAWEELAEPPHLQGISRHDLNEFELGELQGALARFGHVQTAWLVSKRLKEFAWRRAYLLLVELPGYDDETRYAMCRHLEQLLDLPGPVLALWAGHDPTLQDIQRQCFEPVYVAPAPAARQGASTR